MSRLFRRLICMFLLFSPFILSRAASADESSEVAQLKSQIASLTSLVTHLSNRVEQLEQAREFDQELSVVPPAPTVRSPTAGSSYQNPNPDISVAGVAIGKTTSDKRDPDRNVIGLHESEIVLTKNISPYSRGNLTLGFHGEHAEVEEGFIDFAHLLPGKVEARIGKFLTPAGVLNTIHPHDWPIVARPLSMEYFFGDHGLSEDGISFSAPIDLRSKTYLKANLDLLKGSNTIVFNNAQTRAIGGRVMSNTPLNDRDDVNLGFNFHRGSWNPAGGLDSQVYGADLMLRRRFNQFDRLVLWGEWLWNRRDQVARGDLTSAGYYVNALYKFKKDRNWHVGLEYDCSEKPGDLRFNSIGRSVYLGYWLTENDRLQLQFRNLRDPFRRVTSNEVWLEVIWGMGPHKPHLANF